ncbi:MAG: hypothetical protein ACK6AH_02305 [Gemmatimonadota bacterium]
MMDRIAAPTLVKLLVIAAGLLLFGWGVRTESRPLRWYGIAAVGVAAAMRFWKAPSRRE